MLFVLTELTDLVGVMALPGHEDTTAELAEAVLEGAARFATDILAPLPPLTKEYLSKRRTFDRLLIRPPSFWTDCDVGVIMGRRVVSVDASTRRATLDNRVSIVYSTLIWSAGAEPRKLSCPGATLAGVSCVRTRTDVDPILAGLSQPNTRVVVVGGGYIGLETAATLRELGHPVTVIESQGRLLARVVARRCRVFSEPNIVHVEWMYS
jgi:3-phenylpropionate/trans-cinnamate dioxygenase ferredoxin reductase subunit